MSLGGRLVTPGLYDHEIPGLPDLLHGFVASESELTSTGVTILIKRRA